MRPEEDIFPPTTLWSFIQDKLSQTKVFLSTAYFKAATLENSVKGLKKNGIGSHNPLMFSEHDFAAFKTTVHVVVGNETNSNRANF
ncbi:hypothetical protein TNCV_4684021 [Trichonephila clavipes]|nr:hypothetical protein TNCV_4684021 [Trichonephila clavipes]